MKKNIKAFCTIVLLNISFFLFASSDVSQERLVRFALWAQTDVYPGYFDSDKVSEEEKDLNKQNDSDVLYSVPIKKIKETAPFLVAGMVYGWKFDYTPSDKARNVKEYFELLPISELQKSEINRINYAKPWIENDKLSAWIEFKRTDQQIHYYKAWTSINHPRIKGTGYASLSEGFDGIKKACEEALKNAVREYERTQIKTKPKEIIGTVLVTEPPLIGIDSGRYRVSLDFFMQSDRIIEYKTF